MAREAPTKEESMVEPVEVAAGIRVAATVQRIFDHFRGKLRKWTTCAN